MKDKLKVLVNVPVSLLKGLRVTMTNMARSKATVRYPEVMPSPAGQSPSPVGDDPFLRPYEMAPRFRGLHGLTKDPVTGDLNCIGCMACAKVCPDDLISMDLEKREGHNGRYPVTFNVNIGPCCFCGLCAEVCPTPMRAIVMSDLFEWAAYRRDGANLVLGKDDLERHGEIEVARRRAGREWSEEGKLTGVNPEEQGNPYFQFAPEYEAERQGKSLAEVQVEQPAPAKAKAAKPEPDAAPAPAADPLAAVRTAFEAAGRPAPEDVATFDLASLDELEDRKVRAQLKSAVMKARKALEAGEPAPAAEPAPEPVAETPAEPVAETPAEPAGDETAELRARVVELLAQAGVTAAEPVESTALEALDAIEERKLRGQAKSALRKLQKALGLVD